MFKDEFHVSLKIFGLRATAYSLRQHVVSSYSVNRLVSINLLALSCVDSVSFAAVHCPSRWYGIHEHLSIPIRNSSALCLPLPVDVTYPFARFLSCILHSISLHMHSLSRQFALSDRATFLPHCTFVNAVVC